VQNFKRPSRKTLRIARAQRGPRIFEASEIKLLIAQASPQMRAMIHLGINCGLGQSDLSQLPRSAINFKTSWLNYPRPKTGIERRCWLWPETVKGLKEAMPLRPAPKDPADDGLMFITKYGARWTRSNEKGISICNITQEFKKLMVALDINGHRGFYGLRRGFETIGGDSRDQAAVDFIMGHAPASNDMGAVYRDRLEDDRLVAVAQHVRNWLFPKEKRKLPSARSRTGVSRRGSRAAGVTKPS
jgi:integrase